MLLVGSMGPAQRPPSLQNFHCAFTVVRTVMRRATMSGFATALATSTPNGFMLR